MKSDSDHLVAKARRFVATVPEQELRNPLVGVTEINDARSASRGDVRGVLSYLVVYQKPSGDNANLVGLIGVKRYERKEAFIARILQVSGKEASQGWHKLDVYTPLDFDGHGPVGGENRLVARRDPVVVSEILRAIAEHEKRPEESGLEEEERQSEQHRIRERL